MKMNCHESILRAITPKNEAKENKLKMLIKAVYVEQLGSLFCSRFINSEMVKGWHSKPTPRSEMAKLRRSAFNGVGNADVLLNA